MLLFALFLSGNYALAQVTITKGGTETEPVTIVTNLELPEAPLYPRQIKDVELKGDGTQEHPFEIGSVDEWTAFATIVNYTGGNNQAWGILTADITFTGNHLQPGEDNNFSFSNSTGYRYIGSFDGKGHTITLNQQNVGGSTGQKSTWGGLFWHTSGATINNLKVVGTISTNNQRSGGIIQNPQLATTSLTNCQSSVETTSSYTYQGGLVGHQHESAILDVKNCLFDGTFRSTNNNNSLISGGISGALGGTANINNSYSNPRLIDKDYRTFYPLCISNYYSKSATINESHNYYSTPSTYSGSTIEQGINVYDKTTDTYLSAADIVAGLNTDAAKVTIDGVECDPWTAHNDTVYLTTFARYVDMTGWVADSPASTPIAFGYKGTSPETDIIYTYQKKNADNTYTDFDPETELWTEGEYKVKAHVNPVTENERIIWNGWESTMNFCVVTAPTPTIPYYDGTEQILATAGTTAIGTFYYRLGEDGEWTTTIPSATEPDTYNIYYYVKGDATHNDIGSEEIPAGYIVSTPKAAIIDDTKPVAVGEETFFELMPEVLNATQETITAHVVLPAEANKRITVSEEGTLTLSQGTDFQIIIKDMEYQGIVKFRYLGGHLYGDGSILSVSEEEKDENKTRAMGDLELSSDQPYEVEQAGDLIITFAPENSDLIIQGIHVSPPTGINTVFADNGTNTWYDLFGQRIKQPVRKGIYILNGKKVVIQ